MSFKSERHPARAPRLSLTDVCRDWGNTVALHPISLTIHPGESVALIGPSGSGKTTLLNILGGALSPSDGAVYADDTSMADFSAKQLREFRLQCGYLSQQLGLVPQLKVHHNVLAGLLPRWSPAATLLSYLWPTQKEAVRKILEVTDMGDRQWALTSVLSGGEKQRVAIARSLISKPNLLLVDEPTAYLDPVTASEVTQLIVREATQRGATLIFCTHNFELIRPHVDRVIGMRNGCIHFDESTQNISEDHLNELYAGYAHERN